jgi:hypothetical protein
MRPTFCISSVVFLVIFLVVFLVVFLGRSAIAIVAIEYCSCSVVVETLSCALPLEKVCSPCLVLLLQLDGVF